ncbi:MAG TPA: adenosine kinase [Bacteroidales bacterium]|nr:adenosine kinase [Bacteroidales bacterium]
MTSILGIGNALVDIMTSLESDNLLSELNLPKGSMQIVNEETINNAMVKTKNLKQTLASGGSAANTINGLANLGSNTAFIGKVGNDDIGKFFLEDMIKTGTSTTLLKGKNLTGRALALVSPDSERTFAVNLGAAIELNPEDINIDQFKGHTYFHIEGYLVQNHALIEKALILAKQAGLTVSLDLASYNVVEENIDFLKRIVKEYVDIVFANEEEAKAFTGMTPEDALVKIASIVKIAVVKLGAKGSMIKSGDYTCKIGVVKAKSIDTTGAGDMYASGFLYGQAKGLSLEQSGEIGALLSGKVIETIGPKMLNSTWDSLNKQVARIVNGEKIVG